LDCAQQISTPFGSNYLKRIAFDSNVHKIAIFSDELENVKQLNFSLQKFESDNIEFEKKCSDLHDSLQEEIFLKGVLLAVLSNFKYWGTRP
jgi:hypothetical protein